MEIAIDVLGWIGAIALLGAYAAVSSGRVAGKGPAYQALNLFGSAFLLVNSAYHGALPSAALNIVWIAIGAVTVARIWTRHHRYGGERAE